MATAIRCPSLSQSQLSVNDPSTWKCVADEEIRRFTNTFPFDHLYRSINRPKNVIIFIGDGMSLSTITGTRYLKAYNNGEEAGEALLSFETWPTVSLLRTMSSDRMTTDSAAAATAMFSGAKAVHFTVGLTHAANCCRCDSIQAWQYAKSMFLYAQEANLSTGIVTTTRVTHATPAAAYAKSPYRFWEGYVGDKLQGPVTNMSHCQDIAQQLVDIGIEFNVVLGGGSIMFYPNGTNNSTGKRRDGRNLITTWIDRQRGRNRRHRVVLDKKQFDQLDPHEADYVLGLLAPNDMDYEILRKDQPSLSQMTDKAIRILQRNPNGFLLLVEGGRIDHGHHMNRAKLALTETLEFEKAVNAAAELTDEKETLMIATSDHSHSYHIVGYAQRSQSVLQADDSKDAADGLPYLVSTYANGPGARANQSRDNPLLRGDVMDNNYQQQALVPLDYATHEAEDVPLYAIGPYRQLFQRPTDNTYVAYATMFALCLGPYQNATHCAAVKWTAQTSALLISVVLVSIF